MKHPTDTHLNVLARISAYTRRHNPHSPVSIATNCLYGCYNNWAYHVWEPPLPAIRSRLSHLFFTAISETQTANLPALTTRLELIRDSFDPPLNPNPDPWD